MLKEAGALWIQKKEFPMHYFGRTFYKKDAPSNIGDFLTMKQLKMVHTYLVERNKQETEIYNILNDKLKLHDFCKAHAIPTPEIFSHNHNNEFHVMGRTYPINTVTEFKDYFKRLMGYHEVNQLFIKPIVGSGGFKTAIITIQKLEATSDQLFDYLTNGSYLHQEVIRQNKILDRIHDRTLNTMRVETYRDNNNEVHILGAFLRFGHGDMIVDNASSGGFMISVDLEKGTLFKSAFTSLIYGSKRLTEHPDSGQVFEGFELPFYDETIALIKRLGDLLPCKFHGWDIAFTENGPLIIEGNYSSGMLAAEFSYHGYKNKPSG